MSDEQAAASSSRQPSARAVEASWMTYLAAISDDADAGREISGTDRGRYFKAGLAAAYAIDFPDVQDARALLNDDDCDRIAHEVAQTLNPNSDWDYPQMRRYVRAIHTALLQRAPGEP